MNVRVGDLVVHRPTGHTAEVLGDTWEPFGEYAGDLGRFWVTVRFSDGFSCLVPVDCLGPNPDVRGDSWGQNGWCIP